ncbi:type II toxin-antitoxin system VapC family toxin [Demequina sp.]|uniref:type II toxin-antitoxin system VapC family toxin n=1 Tax=Demequina sp. TaxID=2050685 RepID=UPI003D0FFD93
MVIDTSGVIAILREEPSATAVKECLEYADSMVMSAATRVELTAVLRRTLDPVAQSRAERVLRGYNISIVDFTAAQAAIADRAFKDFGQGSGHPARLNFGDCFSYALATSLDEPLLFVGDDFSKTDVVPALA